MSSRRGGAGGRLPGAQLPRDLDDVVAAVAVVGKLDVLAQALEVAQPHAHREDVHLPAGVVDVVLALHVVAARLEQVRDRGAVGGAAAVADVQRAVRIRGHELDDHARARAAGRCGRRLAPCSKHVAHDGRQAAGCEMEVDEARAGDLDLRDARDRRAWPRRCAPPARAASGRAALASSMAMLVAKSPCARRACARSGAAPGWRPQARADPRAPAARRLGALQSSLSLRSSRDGTSAQV